MSLRLAPPATHPSSISNTGTTAPPHPTKGAPSAPGLPDTLRQNLTSPAPNTDTDTSSSSGLTPSSTHPLESRLLHWRKTQDALKMENQRRVYGIAEPLRRGMELKIVREGSWRPAALSVGNPGLAGNVQEDILVLGGRDTEVGWEDVFGGDETREPVSFHSEMEQRLKMNW